MCKIGCQHAHCGLTPSSVDLSFCEVMHVPNVEGKAFARFGVLKLLSSQSNPSTAVEPGVLCLLDRAL
jgi:hypothetical protein